MGRFRFWCAVPKCPSHYGWGKEKVTSFHLSPDPTRIKTVYLQNLARIRLSEWEKAIPSLRQKSSRICSKHFVSGKPAALTNVTDIDWVPTLMMRSPHETSLSLSASGLRQISISPESRYELLRPPLSGTADKSAEIVATEEDEAPEEPVLEASAVDTAEEHEPALKATIDEHESDVNVPAEQELQHWKRHPKVPNLPYQCRYCTNRFRHHRDMMPHMLTHSKLEKLTCPMCPKQVYSAFGLVKHMQIHNNPNKNDYFKCVTCSVRFSSCKQLEEHYLVSHPKNRAENKTISRTMHVCFLCDKEEGTWPELLLHMRIHKGPLVCELCLLSLKSSDSFAEHVVKVHKDMGELTYHRCANPVCPQEFISTGELKQHEQTCLPLGGEYRCEICDQLYREVDHFITHMQLHSMLSNEMEQKVCPHCVLTTKDPADYAEHLVNQHGCRDHVKTLEQVYDTYLMMAENDASTMDDDSDEPEAVTNDEEEDRRIESNRWW